MRKRPFITFCLALLAAAVIGFGYFSWNASIRKDKGELPRYGLAPPFDLKDQNGASVDNERLRGKIWVANFLDLAEPGSSALLGSSFAELDRNFQKAERLILISIVIPTADRDEPRLIDLSRRYLASSHWHFLSGEPRLLQIVQDRWKSLVSASADGSTTFRALFLVDSEGVVRGVYDWRSPEMVQRVLEDIGTLLRTSIN